MCPGATSAIRCRLPNSRERVPATAQATLTERRPYVTESPLISDLRVWVANHDEHTKAAVELLINHDYWLRRRDFIDTAVLGIEEGGAYIAWSKAREAYDRGDFDRASTTELSVLDLAIAIGEDRYKFTSLGSYNRQIVVDAIATALSR